MHLNLIFDVPVLFLLLFKSETLLCLRMDIKKKQTMEKMEPKKSKKGVKLGIGIVLGTIVGYITSNMQLWFVLGIAIGAALEYGVQQKS